MGKLEGDFKVYRFNDLWMTEFTVNSFCRYYQSPITGVTPHQQVSFGFQFMTNIERFRFR
ncbi:MAG TPA: hypothetical protein PKX96_05885 [Dysgonamonadaceae bacterium]|jgi:hypothetical protein|nr:hypothetical protein [Dysgonamonadaceae bacterium]